MKITSVEPQKKNPRRFNIYLDEQFAFGADEDLVINRRLLVGKEIQQDDLNKILFEAEVGKLMERMYRLFGIRQRSEKEVKDYFRIKLREISQLVIDATILSLKKKGMINDEQFAKAWMESRSKKYGVNRIKQELFQKGIDRDIIDQVIGEGENEKQVAEKALEKKLRLWKNLKPMEFRKKAYGYLMRRGFEYETTKSVVEKYIKKEYN